MGGRGGSGGFSSSALDPKAKTVTIETYYRRSGRFGSHYGDSVLEAKQTSDGNIVFSYADANFSNDRQKANTQDVTFEIKHGAVTHFNNGRTQFYGINWDKVKSVSGQTYDIKSYIKDKGFKWDRENKRWVRKE